MHSSDIQDLLASDLPRHRELGWLLDALEREAPVTAIIGLPGSGKTWLLEALIAHLNASARVVTRVQTPTHSALKQPGVVVCDGLDLRSVEELATHLGPSTQLVFTSRRRPAFHAALVELGPLALATAAEEIPKAPATRLFAELLRRIAPAQVPDSAARWALAHQIAEAVDGLPGALILAAEGARLMDLATLARRIDNEPETLFGPLTIALRADLAQRTPAECDALARLATCPHGVLSTTAEALLSDIAPTGPLTLLSALRDHHLLHHHRDRLVVPRLIARALPSYGSPDVAHHVARSLAASAARMCELAERRGHSTPLEWIGQERDNLLTALDVLSNTPEAWPLLHALLVERSRGASPPDAAFRRRLVAQVEHFLDALPSPLPDILHPTLLQFARLAFDYRDSRLLARLTQRFAELVPESFARAWADGARAIVDNTPDLRERLEHTLEVGRRTRDRLTIGHGLTLVSAGLGVLDHDAARDASAEAREHFESADNAWGLALALANLTYFAMCRGEVDTARRHGREAIAVAAASGDKKSLATTLGNLGLLELDQGDLVAVHTLLERSLAIHEAMGRPDFVAACLNGLARVAVESASLAFTPAAARELDRLEGALLEIERCLGPADRRLQHLDSALVRAEMALLRADPGAARELLDNALASLEPTDPQGLALTLYARRSLISPESSAPHRAAVADLHQKVGPSPQRSAAQAYFATWCTEVEWATLAPELGRLARGPLTQSPPLGLSPAWNNNALVRAALRTAWPLLSESRRQDVEIAARDPERRHLVVTPSTGRFRMPGQALSDVSRRPLLMSLLALLVSARERGIALDEPTLGEALWPGERMLEDARSNRIQNAVSLLRKAGLKDHLERVGEAYRIDPKLPLLIVSGARELLH